MAFGGMVSEASASGGPKPGAPAGRSFLVGCGIGLVLIIAAFAVLLIRGRAAEAARVQQTRDAFAALRGAIEAADKAPPARGLGSDFTGQEALKQAGIALPERYLKDGFVVDGWGNPINYRSDGQAFRLHSCGPNGRDEDGTFDDLNDPPRK